jgi:hypothetical protein
MGKNAEPSARFVQELADLCGEVAKLGYEIDTAKMLFGHFGSWTITVIKGHQGIEFCWDGREKQISVKTWPKPNSGALKHFPAVCETDPVDPKKWVIEYLQNKS